MPRSARVKSETGIYHMVLRGINRQTIFEDDEDAQRFLDTLGRYKQESDYKIYAYCLMGNHIHILIQEGKEELGLAMRRIGASYVYWYNYKYERSGHLFQDRFKSENVEDEQYLLTVLRYIHQNPLKAFIVPNIKQYQWSSYNDYLHNTSTIADLDFILDIFDNNRKKAISLFKTFHEVDEGEECLDVNFNVRIKDSEAIEIIKGICHVSHAKDIQKLELAQRDNYLKKIKAEGLSTRQIARLTGVTRHSVLKA